MSTSATTKTINLKSAVIMAAASLLLLQASYSYGWDPVFVSKKSGSMLPTIKQGSMFVIGHPGRYSKISSGDMLAFFYPKNIKETFIDRVVATPGEVIKINGNTLYINGNLIPQKYIGTFNYRPEGQGAEGMVIPTKEYEQELGGHHFHIIEFDTPEAQMNFGPYKVPNDCYFVMGDNRDNVNDSRFWGCVPKQNILGKIHLYKLKKQ
ncbi:signal peptidase I [Acidithiobacillus sulfuriphilus]|uniref:Signal peptidase I n=2 Tax=Acidithiobacillus sulfuriphilus TaxID=1867749 RepID=A0A3M8QNE0_9PROT|nr:signal peptidase I [Acidithiobacillus sulfuriphilus]RNF57769.1 signal peptidase I [Acidithiobacillus sulfuriphilus]